MVINLLREPFFVNFKLLKGLNFIAFLSFISENTELRSNENSGQAHRARQETDSSKFLELLYYLPKKGEGGADFLSEPTLLDRTIPTNDAVLNKVNR